MADVKGLAEKLFAMQRAKWKAEWALRDMCLALVQLGDEMLIRQVAAEWSVSHRWIRSLAALALYFPPETRCPDKSVLTHSAWRNKDLAQ